MDDNKILFVDLDGTLIKEDLSYLAFFDKLKKNPIKTFIYTLIFFLRGKAYLKERVSNNYVVPLENLTFNRAALEFIRDVKNRQRVVYLISGSHQNLVDQVHNHLKIFFEAFGTKDNYNMVGINKVNFIKNNLNIHDFQYFGNSIKDMPIWNFSKTILYTNANKKLKKIILASKLDKKEIKEFF